MAYTVAWSEQDRAWVATSSQHPSLSWLADDAAAALAGLLALVTTEERIESARERMLEGQTTAPRAPSS